MELVLCWPTTPEHKPAVSVVDMCNDTPLEKSNFLFANS